MKRQKRVSISIYIYIQYMNKYIYGRQTDMRPGLLNGEWGQGS